MRDATARVEITRRIELPDGGAAELRGGELEVRDREGRVCVRYRDGSAEICAPAGDLLLSAPEGRVVVTSGLDVRIEAARDVTQRAGRRVDLAASSDDRAPALRIEPGRARLEVDRLEVSSRAARAVLGQAEIVARSIATTAERVALSAGHYEAITERLVQRSRDALLEVADLAEERVGRMRTFVEETFSLSSRRTSLRSEEETSIDGRRVLLG
jgi:hypothetical protein